MADPAEPNDSAESIDHADRADRADRAGADPGVKPLSRPASGRPDRGATRRQSRETSRPAAREADPRRLAAEAVAGLERDGRRLDALLDELFAASPGLEGRDRGLAFEIAVGTVRRLSLLDHLLAIPMKRPLERRRHWTRAVMRTALHQIRFTRIPARAAIHQAVELIKNSPERHLAGMVNAVLRKAAALDPAAVLAEIADSTERLALETAHPLWLVRRWVERLGVEGARARLGAGNRPGPIALRINPLVAESGGLGEALREAGVAFDSPPGHAGTLILPATVGAVTALPGFEAGWFAVQDPAAQRVARFLELRRGEAILDACAAPGGKSALLAALLADAQAPKGSDGPDAVDAPGGSNGAGPGTILALEKRAERIVRLRENLQRLRVENVAVRQGDAGDPETLAQLGRFDAILVDAPCTGTGIIRRHPDIKWRRSRSDLKKLVREQGRILSAVADRLKPGGRLVYAVCSLEPEEGPARVARFLADHPGWRRDPLDAARYGLEADMVTPEGDFAVEPGQGGMDGFYAARLRAPG